MKRVYLLLLSLVMCTMIGAQNANTSGSSTWTWGDSPFWNNWGLDVMPSVAVGISGILGDHLTVPQCGVKIDGNVQFYQKRNGLPQGLLAETALGYALAGGGGMPLNYFSYRLSGGYVYPLPHDITIWALIGPNLFVGGGRLYAYYSGTSKTYYANAADVGIQLKFAAEWHNISAAISYDQGFVDVIRNSSLTLKSYGVYLHAGYRLWNIPKNKINLPKL